MGLLCIQNTEIYVKVSIDVFGRKRVGHEIF